MKERRRIESLGKLVDLREREVERLCADVADKQATRQRYLGNLARLEQLCNGSGASGALAGSSPASLSPVLSLNCGGYKEAVMRMADAHRVDLSLHETEMRNAQLLMAGAVRRQESLELVLTQRKQGVVRSASTREQKSQNDLAAQVWQRNQKMRTASFQVSPFNVA